jgi:hypothetical protein
MFENEEWQVIEELPHYMISSHGRVKHIDRIEARTVQVNERGFPVILLSSRNTATRYMRQINHLVAKAFLAPPLYSDCTAVWHKDGDLQNCHYSNLRWETRSHVLEWNEMHRSGRPLSNTPPVKNNRTGEIYKDAYDCAMAEGVLESYIRDRVEKQGSSLYDDNARYRYVPDSEIERNLR